ncbi:molybdenum cofactor guanylyltransferase [Thermodesulfobacteriota bacterium]
MKLHCTGIILAGGLNTRFSGQDKALIRVGGKRILDRIYEVFSDLFDEIILVTNDPIQYLDWDFNIVTDLFSVRSSLTGIHAGLFYATNPHGFFAACDTPFLKKELIETILDNIETNYDAIIPEISAGLEPLCAIYSKKCLKRIEQHLAQDKLKIQLVFQKDRIKKIPESLLLQKDPELLSFFNINTPADLEKAEAILSRLNN